MFKLIVLFITLAIGSRASALQQNIEEKCTEQRAYLTEAYTNREGLSDILRKATDSKLVVFGESHTERSSKFYAYAFEQLVRQNPKINCLLIEQPRSQLAIAFNACNANASVCDRSQLPDFSGIKQAYTAGLKVFPVDADPIESFGDFLSQSKTAPTDFLENVQTRNEEMAKNTIAFLDSKKCTSAILIIGSMHAHTYPGLKSISDFLTQKKITSYKIEIASPGYNDFDRLDQKWIWTRADGAPLCTSVASPKGENFGFENRAAAGLPVIYSAFSDPGTTHREFLGDWSDYNASIFLGCSDPRQKTCAVYKPDDAKLMTPRYLN